MNELKIASHSRVSKTQHPFTLKRCDTFWSRLRGFAGRREIDEHELLWLKPCSSVHTFGMRVSLSLIFIDSSGRCLKVVQSATPFRAYGCLKARGVIEMRARSAEQISAVWRVIAPALRNR